MWPHHAYWMQFWSPCLKKDIIGLEQEQRRGTVMAYVWLQRQELQPEKGQQRRYIIVINRIITDLEKVNMKLLFTVFSRVRTSDY